MPVLVSFLFSKRDYTQGHLNVREGVLKRLKRHAWPGQSPRSSQQEVRCPKSSAKRKEEEQLPEKWSLRAEKPTFWGQIQVFLNEKNSYQLFGRSDGSDMCHEIIFCSETGSLGPGAGTGLLWALDFEIEGWGPEAPV